MEQREAERFWAELSGERAAWATPKLPGSDAARRPRLLRSPGHAPQPELEEAWEGTPSTAPGKLCGEIGTYIGLVRKVEAAYPKLSAEDVLNALRRVAGTDDRKFQLLLGTPPGKELLEVPGNSGITQGELKTMQGMSRHRPVFGVMDGNAKDSLGHDVSLGHVLCGLSGGNHRAPIAPMVQIGRAHV